MNRALVFAFALSLVVAVPAFADDTPSGVAADVHAVQKDNQSINQTNADLAKDRAAKAQDKANGNLGGQAVDSVKVGVDKVSRSIKSSNKSSDQDTLNSDVNSAVNKPTGNN